MLGSDDYTKKEKKKKRGKGMFSYFPIFWKIKIETKML